MVNFKNQENLFLSLLVKPYFLLPNVLKRWSSQKNRTGIWCFLYYLERWYFFFPKIWYFFFRLKMKDDLSQKMHGNMIFSVYVLQIWYYPSAKKKQRWSSPKKVHLKVTFPASLKKDPRKCSISVEISYWLSF